MVKKAQPPIENEITRTEQPFEQTALALAPQQVHEITPAVWNMMKEIAQVTYRKFGMTHPGDAAAILLKGYEIGFGTAASYEFIQCIAGQPPTVSPRGAMALLHNSPVIKDINLIRLTDTSGKFIGFECTMTRKSGFSYTSRFTMDDGARAGLTEGSDIGGGKIRQGKGNWEKYPENMCMWRAIGFAADVVAPDIIAGMTSIMKNPEAFGVGLTDRGDVIIDATPIPPANPLTDLLARYPAADILTANNGAIPQTAEEIEAVAAKLSTTE
jgi:hypothetical protein